MHIIGNHRILSGFSVINLQRILSQVNLKYNGIADGLAKCGNSKTQFNQESLTYLELYSECEHGTSPGKNRQHIHGIFVSALERQSVFKVTGDTKLLCSNV
ncbi:hypothetical protein TNCT_731031 [Trichonephila clavata]|uniref:Uncharacterized protein n=1 Tax=Trichonephila clavata TaxID=2740835 RepID=A0A8X6F7I9_TRICU|nr:hypothetical protein TNCT_731031 [Trichonephila clavata]